MKTNIPDELLPKRYRGKGYKISIDCHVYGVRGHQLKENTECEYGLNAPKVLGRNLWWLYAMTFYGECDWSKVILDENGIPMWCSDAMYYEAVEVHQGYKPRRMPLNEEQKKFIRDNYKDIQRVALANMLNISRKTVHKYIKETN